MSARKAASVTGADLGINEPAMRPAPPSIAACVIAVIAVTTSGGCRWDAKRRLEPLAGESSHATPSGVDRSTRTFVNVPAGARVTYPPGWEPAASPEFELLLLPTRSPARSSGGATNLRWGEHFISLDIPKLPAFRIPGFLPMDRILDGYVEDLRKQASGANVEALMSPSFPDARAALVRTTWPGDRPTHVETALILTHADRVYILRGRSRAEDEPMTRAAFDQVAQSLRWGVD